ncbi:MAG: thiamine pyrophosphate-dependent enzyme [Candidatus Bathyarchaeota archaeon]|nr:thiamine pyrophosphate-dependent enzyme [Candidatus Bathyarchaeota archaeon]
MSKPIPLNKLDDVEFITPANSACQGCAGSIVARIVAKVIGKDMVRQEVACCGPAFGNINQPAFYGEIFEGAGAMMTGFARAFKRTERDDIRVVGIVGDGGTTDIGFQGLSAAAERDEDFLWVCYDNEAYMNTGGQRSSATTKYATTTTTPLGEFSRGKKEQKKPLPLLVAMHRVPYTATASVAYPEDFIGKLSYAKPVKGFRFIQVSAPCPTGWRFDPRYSVKVAKDMVLSGLWPLYEVTEGTLKLSLKPKELKPVKDVLRSQGRFRHITDDEVDDIQGWVDENWARLLEKDGGPVF